MGEEMNIPPFEKEILRQVCNILGDTDTGLTGNQIGQYLRECALDDPMPKMTKRIRLFTALDFSQVIDHGANDVCVFIEMVMNPVLHLEEPEYFKAKQAELNRVLRFEGLRLTDEGLLNRCARDRAIITDAETASDELRRKLVDRGVHRDVLESCRTELFQENYFHAVFEAAKSVSQKISDRTGLTSDGAALVDQAFGMGGGRNPLLAFNALETRSEISEHKGLMTLMKGFFGAFRNPTAHVQRSSWEITEQDALDMMTVASLLHRRLDAAIEMRRS